MKNKTSPSNLGAVVSVRGSVVDIRFDAHLPPIYSLLHAKDGENCHRGLSSTRRASRAWNRADRLPKASPAASRWKTRAGR